MCLADSVQAMSSNRPYRKSLDLEEVKAEIIENAGTQFDPSITYVLLELLEDNKISLEIPLWTESEASSSESLAKVISQSN